MVFSNIDLLKELYIQSKTRSCVDMCLQAKNGCIFVHWTVLEAAGNDRLVNVGDASSHIVIFPDHSITELEVFFPETILSSTKYSFCDGSQYPPRGVPHSPRDSRSSVCYQEQPKSA